jgi:F-type H+-transporting ATPase subunit b
MDKRMQRFAFMLLLQVPAVALASSGGGHAADPAEQWKVFSFSVVNFLIFAYLMRRFAGPPIKDFLSKRRSEVADAIAAASAAKLEADRVKAEYEAKAARLADSKAELIAEVKAIAEAEHARVIAAANEGADRMRRDAELTAESDLARARRELRAEAAKLATELAGQMIQNKLNDAERERLLSDFIARVQAS